MRISDWSSDVCSSDLSPFDRPITRKFPPPNDQDPEGEDFALPSSGWEAMARGARGRCRARRRSPAASAACRARPYGRTGFSAGRCASGSPGRSEEHTSELQSLMRISYAVFCLKKKQRTKTSKKEKTTSTPHTIHRKSNT